MLQNSGKAKVLNTSGTIYFFMLRGIKCLVLNVDKKGRVHLPLEWRRRLKIKNYVVVEQEKQMLIIKPVEDIGDPISYLSSIHVKTKKSPLEMKREAEMEF